ncbi:MAG: addiction module antidote protein, HigA family [Anaerolinea sp.]|nr:addiction module antidote protein, HigA family [Anaerolinea sp.]
MEREKMNVGIRPARAVAPGRIILRELEARGWSQQDLAVIMGRPEQTISEIIRGKKQITAETARQLAKAFGTSLEFWLNLEMLYQLSQVKQENHETDIERRSMLYHLAPINELIKRGWIQKPNSIDELEQYICTFFQIPTITATPQAAARLRISDERRPEDRAIMAWVRRVEQLAGEQDVKPYSKDSLPSFIDQLLKLANTESNIEKIPALFLENGLHFVIVPPLPKTFVDGAALWINDHPIVALSLRYDRIDAFWFTLLHELAHIYRNHKQIHLDRLFDQDKQGLSPEEVEANKQATTWLFPNESMSEFVNLHTPRYSRVNVEEFAAEQNRLPGLVVGQLMYKGEIKYSYLREYLVKVRPMLDKWVDVAYPI